MRPSAPSKRLLGPFIAVAGIGVFGALIALWFVLGDDSTASNADARPRATSPTRGQEGGPAASAGRGAPSRATPGSAPIGRRLADRTTGGPSMASGEPAPTAPDDTAAAPAQPTLYKELRDVMIDTEPMIVECNERALKTGKKLNGAAAFAFTLVREGDKVVVSTTGIEYSGLGDPESAECMREAARKVKVDRLPDGITSVTAFRKVTFEKGALTENWISEYATDPPTPTPFDPPPSK